MTQVSGPNLGLLIDAAEGENYYTEYVRLLRGLDGLVQCSIISGLTTPPGSPSDGDKYVVTATATGDWAGQEGNIARYADIGVGTPFWEFLVPREGWGVWNQATGSVFRYLSGVWGEAASTITAPAILNLSATANSQIALHANVVANGFDDVVATLTEYDAGASGVTDVANRVIMTGEDKTAGNMFFYSFTLAGTGVGGGGVARAVGIGPGIAPLFQVSGVTGFPTTGLVNGVDELADLINGAATTPVFDSDNDTMTIGFSAVFGVLILDVDTPASSTGIDPTFEYSTGVGTWAVFTPADGTSGLTASGNIIWGAATLIGWAISANGTFDVRITRTKNGLGTTPILSLVQLSAGTNIYSWDEDGNITAKSATADNLDGILGANTPAAVNGTAGNFSGNFAVNAELVTQTGLFPAYQFVESDVGADEKRWRTLANGSRMIYDTRTDSDGTGKRWLEAVRSGLDITGIALGNAVDVPPVNIFGDLVMSTSGKGIDFSASGGGVLDYDDDAITFTPVMTDNTNDATQVQSVGHASRRGQWCEGTIYIQMSSKGSLSGDMFIKNLPFPSKNDLGLGQAWSGLAGGNNITAGEVISGYVVPNSDTIKLQLWDVATGSSHLQDTELNNGSIISLGFKYRVA